MLERVGTALGAREGTGPDDDPLLRSQRRQGYERGRMRGRLEARVRMVRRMLLLRGIEVSDGFPAGLPVECDEDAVVTAALACRSEADFLARLREGSP